MMPSVASDRATTDRELATPPAVAVEADADASHLKDLRHFMDKRVVLTSILLILLWFLVGTLTYSLHLGWTVLESLYFLCATPTTVGYGDLAPKDDFSKLYTCFLIIVGMLVAGQAIGVVLVEFSHTLRERSDGSVLCSSVATIFSFLCLGTLVFCLTEDLSFTDALYLTVVSVTSVGYGDIHPRTEAGRLFAILFLLPATIATAQAMSAAAAVPMKRHKKNLEMMVIKQYGEDLTIEELENLIQNPFGTSKIFKDDTTCSRNEFMLKLLVKLDKVSVEMLEELSNEFDRLDNDESGVISLADMVGITHHKLKRHSPHR